VRLVFVHRTLYIMYAMLIPLAILIMFVGLALHAAYVNCEPLIKGTIKTGDQVSPYKLISSLP